jgi:hypothetical protein
MKLTGTREQMIDQAVQYRIKTEFPPGTVIDNKTFAAMWKETAETLDARVRRHPCTPRVYPPAAASARKRRLNDDDHSPP